MLDGEIETTLTEMLARREILPAHFLTLMLILVEGNQDISSQQSNQNIRQLIRPDDTDFFSPVKEPFLTYSLDNNCFFVTSSVVETLSLNSLATE